jgi:hypothetical protein
LSIRQQVRIAGRTSSPMARVRGLTAGLVAGGCPRVTTRPLPVGPAGGVMGWDDEELDTQIFDKEEVKPVAAEDLFFEDDDRTVANEPAPDILEQARPPELMMQASEIADTLFAMINLPDQTNFMNATILPIGMPFLGRG